MGTAPGLPGGMPEIARLGRALSYDRSPGHIGRHARRHRAWPALHRDAVFAQGTLRHLLLGPMGWRACGCALRVAGADRFSVVAKVFILPLDPFLITK